MMRFQSYRQLGQHLRQRRCAARIGSPPATRATCQGTTPSNPQTPARPPAFDEETTCSETQSSNNDGPVSHRSADCQLGPGYRLRSPQDQPASAGLDLQPASAPTFAIL